MFALFAIALCWGGGEGGAGSYYDYSTTTTTETETSTTVSTTASTTLAATTTTTTTPTTTTPTTTTIPTTTTTPTTTTPTTSTPTPITTTTKWKRIMKKFVLKSALRANNTEDGVLDINTFLDIIAHLTSDYETNLTMEVNETISKMKIPECLKPKYTGDVGPGGGMGGGGTTAGGGVGGVGGGGGYWTKGKMPKAVGGFEEEDTTTIESPDYSGFNRSIIAKCFVCGLEGRGVPYDANCADAFAGDFLPIVPQEPRARAQMTSYKKYCRYGAVRNYFLNGSQPRSIYGRWTGGCSVRWSDLSGIYTQRSCRNRRRPTTGRHYASKRMAKLEMALVHLDDGCIVSSVATLLPLSRGISLFSRIHACVCSGAWCNTTEEAEPSITICTLLILVAKLLS